MDALTESWFTVTLSVDVPAGLVTTLEGLSLTVQGALLIGLLVLIAGAARLGLEPVAEGLNRWTGVTLALVVGTLLVAAPRLDTAGSIAVGFTGRFFVEAALLAALGLVAARGLERHEIQEWLWETWRFVKQIFPLLLVGVFGAGVFRVIIPTEWIQVLAGENTLLANFIGVAFGVFMYFPTLVEVSIARMFLDLGMARGPLLAYLMADPELSLQSILVTSRIIGWKKNVVYVGLVSVFSTLAGWLFGLVLAVL